MPRGRSKYLQVIMKSMSYINNSAHFSLTPLAGAVGAELLNIDLGADLSDSIIAEIRQALLDYGVIFFRDQDLDADSQKRLARRFGDIFIHPFFDTRGQDPEIVMIHREPGDTHIIGEDWHSDTAMVKAPPMGAILFAVEVPDYGGDTLFASQVHAYDALSKGMKRLIADLKVVNSDIRVAGPTTTRNENRTTKSRMDPDWVATETAHPIVRTHPETGRKSLYCDRSYSIRFEGMTEEESAPVLEYLMDWGTRPEFTCRFRWRNGSVAFWDNRCTKHIAVDDSHKARRIMRRIQIAGDCPF